MYVLVPMHACMYELRQSPRMPPSMTHACETSRTEPPRSFPKSVESKETTWGIMSKRKEKSRKLKEKQQKRKQKSEKNSETKETKSLQLQKRHNNRNPILSSMTQPETVCPFVARSPFCPHSHETPARFLTNQDKRKEKRKCEERGMRREMRDGWKARQSVNPSRAARISQAKCRGGSELAGEDHSLSRPKVSPLFS
ncbi:hypothetical protein VTK26DRAFT_6926 [Humicola hyalothermophila]